MESSGDPSGPPRTPLVGGARGLPMGRRLPASISPGRLPTMRSRDLTLGGVKKKTFTPNIIGRKSKEELKADEGMRRDKKDVDRGRQRGGRGRGRGRPEVIQSHSIFEQGPSEMMAKRRGVYEDTKETANSGPSPIINIKKERETEEETKEILRKLEKDDLVLLSCPTRSFSQAGALGIPEPKKARAMFQTATPCQPDLLPDLLEVWNHCKRGGSFSSCSFLSLPGRAATSDVRPPKQRCSLIDGQDP
ncbi:hypothetical protein cypCar_00013145 [Cyprinus carpio]|nr:hypothetical protein cypCar_00013145 [Cyprinus carpio]